MGRKIGDIDLQLEKLLPEKLGGEYHYNYWNLLLKHTIVRWITERNHRPFVALISGLRPQRILEIGVGQGWGAERMVKAAGRKVEYYGFDLFYKCAANKYISTPMNKIRKKLERLGVQEIHLFSGDSRETLPRELPNLPKMDFIYIDGGRSYEVVKSDWENVRQLMHDSTVVVFNDYNLQGVKQVVDGIKRYKVDFIRCVDIDAIVRGGSEDGRSDDA